MDPGHCASPGCYFRSINYKASSRQMAALVELSVECSQSIKVSYPIENKNMILGCIGISAVTQKQIRPAVDQPVLRVDDFFFLLSYTQCIIYIMMTDMWPAL